MTSVPEINLVMAWVWILGGFLTGAMMGLRFQDPKWLGGYASHRRRMYRLGHISFFGLGFMNLLFFLTAERFELITPGGMIASGAFILGALTMPLCCALMARNARFQWVFGIPVTALIGGAVLTIIELLR